MTDITELLRLRTDPSQMLMCYPPRPAPDMLCYEAADEIERLREMRADWRAAMTENHDLWRENERLQAALREIAEVYAGSEGIPQPITAAEGYLLQLLMEMVGIARVALEGEKKDD